MSIVNETLFFNLFANAKARDDRKPTNPQHLRNGVFLYHTQNDKESAYYFGASLTEHGDGIYPCRDSNAELGECQVDAGVIAAIPIAMIEKHGYPDGQGLGVVHHFTGPFQIKYDNGSICFGSIWVDTTIYCGDATGE